MNSLNIGDIVKYVKAHSNVKKIFPDQYAFVLHIDKDFKGKALSAKIQFFDSAIVVNAHLKHIEKVS